MDSVFQVPAGALFILGRLKEQGCEGVLVGGCVRDLLRGTDPNDFDICTNALPEQVMRVFSDVSVYPVGLRHGTVLVVYYGEGYEITTYRTEGAYSDHRHPDEVNYVTELSQDLARRDFTVNAMAWSPERGLVDIFGGREDLKRGLIRCVGAPQRRFSEDALRILRALRFSVRLGFEIEKETSEAICACMHLLDEVARERIFSEWKGILTAGQLLPNLHTYREVIFRCIPGLKMPADIWEESVTLAEQLPPDPALRMACLFRKAAPAEQIYPLAVRVLTQLRSDGDMRRRTALLASESVRPIPSDRRGIQERLLELGEETLRDIWTLRRMEAKLAGAPEEELSDGDKRLEEVLKDTPVRSIKDLAVNGKDLLDAGIPRGRRIGAALDAVFREVLEGRIENQREAILEYLQRLNKTAP